MAFFEEKGKIALKIPGGRYKQVYFAFGSVKAYLENTPIKLHGGKCTEKKILQPATVSIYIGSSAGAINATVHACGYSLQEMEDCFFGKYDDTPLKMPTKQDLKRRPNNRWNILKHPINHFLGQYTTQGIKEHVEKWILRDITYFSDLDPELYIFAVEANRSRTVVFGKQESKQINDHQYRNHATISQAIAASTALPGLYLNYPIFDPASNKIRYYEDGDIRDFFDTDVAQNAKCDLVLIPCIYLPTDEETFRECTEPGLKTLLRAYSHVLDHSLDTRLKKAMYNRAEKKNTLLNFRKDANELLNPFAGLFETIESSIKLQILKRVEGEDNAELRKNLELYVMPVVHDAIKDVKKQVPVLKDAIDALEERLIKNLNYFPQNVIYVLPKEGSEEAKILNKIAPFTQDKKDVKFCIDLGYNRTIEVLKERKLL